MTVSETLEVDAMCCPGCATNVSDAVSGIEGVDDADADHGNGTINVVYDDESVSEDTIRDAAMKAGCGM